MAKIFSDIGSIAVKSLTAAVVLFILARIMGKKQISQLTFFDYTVGISIGSIAAAASVDKRISILNGIASMIIWAIFPLMFSYISEHSMFARRLLDGNPSILIQNGKIVEENLKKSKFTINDLLEELRIKDIFNIEEVDYAILETSGKLSVLKKASKKTVTVSDMKLPIQKTGVSANIIIDGKMMKQNMEQVHINESWIANELKKQNVHSVSEVLLATCDANHTLHIDRKNADPDSFTVFQ